MPGMASLIIVHDRLVNEVRTVYKLALTSTAVLLVQKSDAVVHVQGGLRGRRHPAVLLL